MRLTRAFIGCALLVTVSASAGVARAAGATSKRAGVTVLDLPRPTQPEWFGLYLMGRKAGYSRSWVGIEQREGRRVLVARSESMLVAAVSGREVRRSQADEKVYEALPAGRLLSFSSRREGDGGDRVVEGRCKSDGCTLVQTAAGRREERWVAVRETAEQADAARLAAARRETLLGEQFELESLRVRRMEDRYMGQSHLAAGGVQEQVARVDELEVGDRSAVRAAYAADGRVLEMRFGEAVVLRPEPEATAKRLDRVQIDMFGMTRVEIPASLPRAVPGRVVFKVRGIPKEYQVPDERQAWGSGAEGEVVLTVTATRPRAREASRDAPRFRGGAAGAPAALRDYLAATPYVDSDAPEIVKVARRVVGEIPGTYAASVKLSHFVYQRLEKVYGVSRDRASEVLSFGKGDCTEHALLFTALARAAGIPARQVQGLVYAKYDDGRPALYWHAWVEVLSGGEWIALDPTFDQPVADATHIALGRGTRPGETIQADTLAILGALKVLSADVRPVG